jgi:hypothetical protein
MTALGTKSRNFNPIGIFEDCKKRHNVVDKSIQLAQFIFTKKGYTCFVPNNPDTDCDCDFIALKGSVTELVSVKSTTQMTRNSSDPKPEINIRTNSKSKDNCGEVTIPKNYDKMIGISHLGTYCIWSKEDLKDVKSTRAFGVKEHQECGEIKLV